MPSYVNAATVGALVREARTTAGLTQTELANRIGASRFWVAEFEKGKPSAELGLALKALNALGLVVRIGSMGSPLETAPPKARGATIRGASLARVIAHTTVRNASGSSVTGWPTATVTRIRSRKP
jgi:HTH-type transcriptional regulator/antitoxin HipB